MRRITEATKIAALALIMGVSFVIALVGLSIQIAWAGQPVGQDGGWVGDVSAGVYATAMVATFVFVAAKQQAGRRRRHHRSDAH